MLLKCLHYLSVPITFLPLLGPWKRCWESQPLGVLVSLSLKNRDTRGLLEVRHASLDVFCLTRTQHSVSGGFWWSRQGRWRGVTAGDIEKSGRLSSHWLNKQKRMGKTLWSSSQFQLIPVSREAVFHVHNHSIAFTDKNKIAINGTRGKNPAYMWLFL